MGARWRSGTVEIFRDCVCPGYWYLAKVDSPAVVVVEMSRATSHEVH